MSLPTFVILLSLASKYNNFPNSDNTMESNVNYSEQNPSAEEYVLKTHLENESSRSRLNTNQLDSENYLYQIVCLLAYDYHQDEQSLTKVSIFRLPGITYCCCLNADLSVLYDSISPLCYIS